MKMCVNSIWKMTYTFVIFITCSTIYERSKVLVLGRIFYGTHKVEKWHEKNYSYESFFWSRLSTNFEKLDFSEQKNRVLVIETKDNRFHLEAFTWNQRVWAVHVPIVKSPSNQFQNPTWKHGRVNFLLPRYANLTCRIWWMWARINVW